MVVIKKRSNVIPIDFGDFQIEFIANDKNVKNMVKVGKKLEADGKELAESEDENSFDILRNQVKQSWTDLFDEKVYKQVYSFANKSTLDTMVYLLESIKGIVSEWEARNSGDALSKYLSD